MLRKAVADWNRRLEAATAQELPPVSAAMLDQPDTQLPAAQRRAGMHPAAAGAAAASTSSQPQPYSQSGQVPLPQGGSFGGGLGFSGLPPGGSGSGSGMILGSSFKAGAGSYGAADNDTLPVRDGLATGTFTGAGLGALMGGSVPGAQGQGTATRSSVGRSARSPARSPRGRSFGF